MGAGAGPGKADGVVAARSEDDVIRKILGLPKQHHLGTIPMYQWIHLVLADKLAYDGRRLILVRAIREVLDMEAKLKHLEMIQGVINRMAGNSFLLKGWSVTLTSALFALAAKDSNPLFVYLAYFPCATFWSLDGYFLHQERLYRKLYKTVSETQPSNIDFSMNATPYESQIDSWLSTCFSITLRIFHGTVFGTILIIMLIMATIGGK